MPHSQISRTRPGLIMLVSIDSDGASPARPRRLFAQAGKMLSGDKFCPLRAAATTAACRAPTPLARPALKLVAKRF